MNKSKKILLSFIASILMITVLFASNVNAASYDINTAGELKNNGKIGDKMKLNGSDLRGREDVYCIEHKTNFVGGQYTVYDIVEINGETATSSGTGKKVTKDENEVMNYILFKGDYSRWMFTTKSQNQHYMTARNIAIWGYQNTWLNALGNGFFNKNWKHSFSRLNISNYFNSELESEKEKAKKLLEEANAFAKSHNGSSNIEITGNKEVKEYETNTYGPFKIKYSGDRIALSAIDINGNAIQSRKIKAYSDQECRKEITKSRIKSNTDFYIKITDETKMKKLKCTASSSILNAKILFLGRNDFWNGNGQGIIFVKPGESKVEKSIEFDIKNKQKISIEGYVWIDAQRTKANDTNSLYDEDETRVAGVTVNLKKKSNNNIVATTKTDSNGYYSFDKKIEDSDLEDHYIEFNYNGVKVSNQDISKYIPVAFNSTNVNEIVKNGSRALMNEVPGKDTDLKGIATTYTGTEKESTYGLGYNSNLYNKLIEGETLKNINLGLKKIPETEYVISENLAYVKIGMKGYDYTYTYGGTGNTSRVAAPRVKWQNSQDIYAYSRDIYPSDIAYDVKNSTQELKVDVTYRIDITNTTNHNIEELYKEQKLYITGLTNNFDTTRYELNDKNWTGNNGTATITDNYKKSIYDNGINTNSTATSYITFSVKHDALLDILNHPNGIIEKNPTKVTAVGHHQYSRKDYSWQNDITKEQTHITSNDTKSADAPYLIFKLGEERILSGKVFEDKVVTTDGQKLGNGVYDENENVVKDVLVELLDINENVTDITKLPVSNLYGVGTDKNAISIPAQVKTDANGNYTLNGIVPGYYYIRFTYGDGTQKIYDISGKEVKDLTAKDYKSTIVTNDAVKQALKDGKDFEWYKKINNANVSVALDNLDTRRAVNAGTSNSNIMAGTARVFITIENTENKVANIEVTENGQTALAANRFNGLNLGVIEMPRQQARLEKIITNIKVTNAQANFGIGGNPELDSIQGVSDLDNTKNGGSKYVRAELQDDYISGANLELTYNIKVTNISDVNYYNDAYYYYGEADLNKEVTLNVEDLTDYLDDTLQFKADASDSRVVVGTDENATNKTILKVQNIGTLYTENNKARETDKLKTSDAVSIIAGRILSKQDDDMEYINEVKITNVSNGTDTRDTSSDKETQIQVIKTIDNNFESKATATITPPTGADRLEIILYTIAGVIALAVLSAGVVMIKRIVKK